MFKSELKKILSNKILWIGLALVFLCSFMLFYSSCLAPDIAYRTVDDSISIEGEAFYEKSHLDYDTVLYNNRYEKILKAKSLSAPYIGKTLTDDLVKEILERQQTQRNNYGAIPMKTPLEAVESEFRLYPNSIKYNIDENFTTATILDVEYNVQTVKSYFKAVGAEEPLLFYYGDGWTVLSNNLALSLMAGLFLVVVLLSTIFSSEHKNKMMVQIITTKNGRKKIVTAKIIASLFVAFSILAGITIQNIIMYGVVYGLEGSSTDLLLTSWGAEIHNLTRAGTTVFDLFVYVILCSIAGYMLISSITLLVSSLVTSEYVSTILSLFAYFIPAIIINIISWNAPKLIFIILNLLPVNMLILRPDNSADWQWCIQTIHFMNIDIPIIFFMFLLYCLISLILFKIIYTKFRNIQITN